MNNEVMLGRIFEVPPRQWGLRGDPYLWEELRAHFANVPLPLTWQACEALFTDAFMLLTAHPLSFEGNFWVERYVHGGMSSGYVCPIFWRSTVMPLLQVRLVSGNFDADGKLLRTHRRTR